MSKTLFKNYIWLVDTIHHTGGITFEEINRKWIDCELSDGKELPIRTFHNWRKKVEEIFNVNIECRKSFNEYYIENEEDLKSDSISNWLLNSFSVSNLLIESKKIKNRISLEEVPSGDKYLSLILESMQENKKLNISYKSYLSENENNFTMSPYFVKLFKQRWYVIGESDMMRVYALDRISSLTKTNEKFIMSEDMDVENYFQNCYGIVNDCSLTPQTIRLRIAAKQSNYVRDLPFHHSQKETERNDEFSIFEYRLIPTYDFLQEIMKYGSQIEVLSPVDFRNELSAMIEEALDAYQK